MILILIKMNDVITTSHVFNWDFPCFFFWVLFKRSPKIPSYKTVQVESGALAPEQQGLAV